MSATGGRFTAYLPHELDALEELRREEGTSTNYLVRVAVRALLGKSVPPRYRRMMLDNIEQADRDKVAAA